MSHKRKRNQVNETQRANSIQITPRTDNQKIFLSHIKNNEQVIAYGAAGTGKTFLATSVACELFLRGLVDKLILTRPAVAACGEDYGYLPGGLNQKLAPWVQPVMEIIEECLGKQKTLECMKVGAIEIAPFGFLRGRTFRNSFVILDEAQNTTVEQMKLLLTRMGEGSRLVISGDIKQSDLHKSSGLEMVINLIRQRKLPVPIVEFTRQDCVRSDMCKMWLEAFGEL